MEKGFYHPDRGYWQTTGEPPKHILDGYPDGTVEVPLKPGAGYEFDGKAWIAPPLPDQFIELNAWRQTAWKPKTQFLIWAKRIGLLSPQDFLAACRGEWPASFTDALSALPGNIDPIEAQGVFAATSDVWRMDPVLNAIAADKGVTDAELDTAFGWTG